MFDMWVFLTMKSLRWLSLDLPEFSVPGVVHAAFCLLRSCRQCAAAVSPPGIQTRVLDQDCVDLGCFIGRGYGGCVPSASPQAPTCTECMLPLQEAGAGVGT